MKSPSSMSCCPGQGWSVGGPSFQDCTQRRSPLASNPGVPSSLSPLSTQHTPETLSASQLPEVPLRDHTPNTGGHFPGGRRGRGPHADVLTRGTAKGGHVGDAPCASAGTNRWETNKTRRAGQPGTREQVVWLLLSTVISY